jgi:hypothetical protein
MEETLEKKFQKAKYGNPENLSENVWRAIIARDQRITRIKLWAFASVAALSVSLLIPAFRILLTDFKQSGFYDYLSLIFSSGGSIISYWKELAFSLAESLPAISIILTLSLLFICFFSMRHLMKQVGKRSLLSLTV